MFEQKQCCNKVALPGQTNKSKAKSLKQNWMVMFKSLISLFSCIFQGWPAEHYLQQIHLNQSYYLM